MIKPRYRFGLAGDFEMVRKYCFLNSVYIIYRRLSMLGVKYRVRGTQHAASAQNCEMSCVSGKSFWMKNEK